MKISANIIPISIIFFFVLTFYLSALNTHCIENCERLEAIKSMSLIVIIISACIISLIFYDSMYNSKNLKERKQAI